jgi:spermidine synthase
VVDGKSNGQPGGQALNSFMLLYLGVAVVAAATIVYEVALTRIFSIAYGYHFAFLAISLGLLGFGMSGTVIALFPKWRQQASGVALAWLALAASASFAGGYLLANNIPLDPYRVGWDPGQLPLLAAYLAAFALPFLLTGLVQGLPITSMPGSAGRIYASALAGSGVGALFALMALERLSAPRALAVAAIAASGGSLAMIRVGSVLSDKPVARESKILLGAAFASIAGLTWMAVTEPPWMEVRMSEYKPLPQLLLHPDSKVVLNATNAQSRIDVVESSSVHSAPGLSLNYQGSLPSQAAAVIDGDIVLPLTRVDEVEPGFFDALPSSLAYTLRPQSRVLVLQPGGGLEVAAALHGQAESVVALESNSLLTKLLLDDLAARSGRIYLDPRVRLIDANPRAYFADGKERFDVISIALSENRRTVTAGAFSLSENYLMTKAALATYLEHLRPGGVLVAHRWLQLPPTEELRTAALVVEALEERGEQAGRNIVAIRSFSTMLILAKNEPFTPDEIAAVRAFAAGRQFDLVHHPGIQPSDTNRANVLRDDRYFDSFREILLDRNAFYREYEYDVRAASDDRPFFFHFFKWSQIPTVLSLLGKTWQPFGGSGYLLVLGLLMVTAGLSAGMLLLPALAIQRRERSGSTGKTRSLWPALYFAMLGLGFLLVEVALVGRFMLVLDHSALAFTMVLFGLLAASGLGSALSSRIPWRPALGALVVLVLLYSAGLSRVLGALLGLGLPLRIGVSLLLIAPLGILMGVAFPRGLSALAATRPSWLPMAWGVNGFTSVIGAVLAALISLSWGYSVVLALGGLAYLIALSAIWKHSGTDDAGSVPLPNKRDKDHIGNVL